MLKKAVLFVMFAIMCGAGSFMAFSMMEAKRQADMPHQVIAVCMEGYAVASFLHGGNWDFAQVFERGADGHLRPVRCGRGPFGDSHWK